MQTRTIQSALEMATIAEEVCSILPQKDCAHVLALSGQLGAGKTTFVKALAKHLGSTEHVTSPTFVLMKHYPISGHDNFHTLTHIDAYRVEDLDEVRILHLGDLYRDAGRIICIEWPENIQELLPTHMLEMTFAVGEDESRTITYTSYGT